MIGSPAPRFDDALRADLGKAGAGTRPLGDLAGIVIDQVADHYALVPGDITGRVQNRRVVWARHVTLSLLAEFSFDSHAEIARQFGIDRTSVDNAVRRVIEQSEGNPVVLGALAALRARIEERAPETRQRLLPARDRAERERIRRQILASRHPDAEREVIGLLRALRVELTFAIRRDPVAFVVGLSRTCSEINDKEQS